MLEAITFGTESHEKAAASRDFTVIVDNLYPFIVMFESKFITRIDEKSRELDEIF
jgi:hypothetical protein